MMTVFRCVLLVALVGCAIATAIVRKPMQAVIIYSAFSVVLAVLWITLEAPDLAMTEAAVGAGVTGTLLYLTLRRLNLIDQDEAHKEKMREEADEHGQF